MTTRRRFIAAGGFAAATPQTPGRRLLNSNRMHHTGVAHVVTEPLERAEFHVEQARSLSRGRGWPLTFSIEPEE